jgi:hypothetical protein
MNKWCSNIDNHAVWIILQEAAQNNTGADNGYYASHIRQAVGYKSDVECAKAE